ncbi:hypothetical protein XU18_3829 [Perkinsela sp. CCAP 1560/4]|nr:hypothetical protein XU18_3829 [Perkinsela sp. CCAP 1560/4]|eukprot:KNH05054.1 hypothetical protein XU18_3829 [Perkinsela sp. CCAP 1560/4]
MQHIDLKLILAFLGHSSLIDYLIHHLKGLSLGFFVSYVLILLLRAPVIVAQKMWEHSSTITVTIMVFRGIIFTKDSVRWRDKCVSMLSQCSSLIMQRLRSTLCTQNGNSSQASMLNLD